MPDRWLRHLGRLLPWGAARPSLQVSDRIERRQPYPGEGGSHGFPLRAAAGNRIPGVDLGLCVAGRRLDALAGRPQRPRLRHGDLRGAFGVMAAQRRQVHELSRARSCARRLSERSRIHPRRVDADHRASFLRIVGLSDHRLFRAHRALRHAAGSDVFHRAPAPQGNRRDSRLGPVTFSERCARSRRLRRHSSVRACRPETGIPSGMELGNIQLWAQRGAQLPHFIGALLVREVPHRRHPGRRGRLDAVPRLRPQGGRMDTELLRRPGESRSDQFPAHPERGGVPRSSRRLDDCRWCPGRPPWADWVSA